jgi:hypothetical protein
MVVLRGGGSYLQLQLLGLWVNIVGTSSHLTILQTIDNRMLKEHRSRTSQDLATYFAIDEKSRLNLG